MEKKITKAMILKAIKEMCINSVEESIGGEGVTCVDIMTYCDTTLNQLDRKLEKAREKAKEKKVNDPLKDAVYAVLAEDFQTRDKIFSAIENIEDVTINKVGARLNKLVEEGIVEKQSVKVENGRKMVYRLITESAE